MSERIELAVYDSPVGPLGLRSDGQALREILLPCHMQSLPAGTIPLFSDRITDQACEELAAWFAGQRRSFGIPLNPVSGTAFQRRVWQEMRRIPWGTTISYAELARRIGRPAAARAVGAASGRNPLPIVIPCHRVIGSDGSLTGYGGGLALKRLLLEQEGSLETQTTAS